MFSVCTLLFLDSCHCRPCEEVSSHPRLSDERLHHILQAALPPPSFQSRQLHEALPCLHRGSYYQPSNCILPLAVVIPVVTQQNPFGSSFSFCLWAGAESSPTWVKERVNADLPRPHESTDLLHISSSHDILKDDVIGEVHAPLCWGDGYDGCRIFLRLHALCWAVPWAFAVRWDIRWRGPVGGGVFGRVVVCRAVLRCCTILAWQRVRRRVLGGCIMCCWAVIAWSVVCRGCVLCGTCVCGYMVVVLHHCRVFCGTASPFAASPGGGMWEIQENTPVQQNPNILLAFPPLLSSSCYPSGFQLEDLLLLLNKTLVKSTTSLHNPIPLLSLERPLLVRSDSSARCLCCCLKVVQSGKLERTPIYPLEGYFGAWDPVTSAEKWMALIQLLPLTGHMVTDTLSTLASLKKCSQPKCCVLLLPCSHIHWSQILNPRSDFSSFSGILFIALLWCRQRDSQSHDFI